MSRIAKVKVGLNNRQFDKMIVLGGEVLIKITGNANFPSPVPTVVTFTAALQTLAEAKVAAGGTGNRGSKRQHQDLVAAAGNFHVMLTQWCSYCNAVARGDVEKLNTCGFPFEAEHARRGPVGAVHNLRRMFRENVNLWQVLLRWKKPENAGTVKITYNVYRGVTASHSAATLIKSGLSKTRMIDTPVAAGGTAANVYYWVEPVTAAGNGAMSDLLMVQAVAPQ